MRNSIIIITILLLLFVFEIQGQQLYNDSAYIEISVNRSKKKFRFAKVYHQKKISYEKIDTNAVYIASFRNYDKKQSDSVYRFLRFYNGFVFFSAPYLSYPSIKDIENQNYGTYCCSKFNKKGYLIIKCPTKFRMDSRWKFYYANVFDNKILLTHHYRSYPPFFSAPGKLNPIWAFYKVNHDFKNRECIWK